MPSFELIDSPAALAHCAAALAARSPAALYLDTEFDPQRERVTLCLIQISDGERIFLVDPMRLDLGPLAPVLGAPGVEWVLHAGRQDVALLMEHLRLPMPERVFDTQVAWALLSPEASVSLAYLEFRLLGLRGDKGHQADDWKRRPLPATQLAYAARDVDHLPAMHALLAGRLEARGRRTIVWDASRETIRPETEATAPLTMASFRNAWQLDAGGQAALVAMLGWAREMTAAGRASELPSDSKTWLAIAGRRPTTIDDLGRLKGVSRRLVEGHGHELIARLARAHASVDTGAFVPLEPSAYTTHAETLARARLELARAHASEMLDVAPELLLPSRQLDRLRTLQLEGITPERLIEHVGGFRRTLLEPVWAEAVRRR